MESLRIRSPFHGGARGVRLSKCHTFRPLNLKRKHYSCGLRAGPLVCIDQSWANECYCLSIHRKTQCHSIAKPDFYCFGVSGGEASIHSVPSWDPLGVR